MSPGDGRSRPLDKDGSRNDIGHDVLVSLPAGCDIEADYEPDDEWTYVTGAVAWPFERGDYDDGRR